MRRRCRPAGGKPAVSPQPVCHLPVGLRRYHSRKVRPRSFQEGDLVLRLIQRTAGQHKLSAPWEGPFIISGALGNDSYYLIDAQKPKAHKRDDSGKESERPWNANLLRRFYS